MSGSYIPKWLNGKIKGISVKALGFVINKQEDRYIGDLTDVETAALISKASGFLGTCSEYLINTSEHLEDLGIPDNKLSNLVKLL